MTAGSVGELVHGACRSSRVDDNLARLGVLLAALVVLPYDAAAASLFGRLKAELGRTGQRPGDLDLQIASIALVHGLPLVTHNQQHLARVPGLVI